MRLGLALTQKMKQELRLTPQLHMSIRHLQLSRLDMEAEIQRELMDNPLLEQVDLNHTQSGETGQAEVERSNQDAEPGDHTVSLDFTSASGDEQARSEMDWDRYQDDRRGRREVDTIRVSNEDYVAPELNYSRSSSLSDHLLDQLRLSDLSSSEKEVAIEIIGNLDERGYIRGITTEELASQFEVDIELVEDVFEALLAFDPVGVGARSLRECLLAQCKTLGLSSLTYRLIDNHLNDLERNRIPQIAKSLGISLEETVALIEEVRRLDPSPGLQYTSESPRYIKPDVYVEWVEGELEVRVNDEGMPNLKINHAYRDQLKASFNNQTRRTHRGERRRRGSEENRYLTERLNAADWFIKSLDNRKRTIVLVMEEIVRIQQDFFVHGPEFLKPLVLKQIAELVDLHESTISRVTSNKYVETPRGLYELKFFFSSTIQSSDGSDDLAGEAVKMKIKRLVSDENPKKPFSYQKLVELLQEDGVSIARRTVAKYREALGIPSSSKRRRHV